MISVSHLSKSFGTVKAVDDLSFQIKKKEIVGLLGPNGAGKSTTMRLLTGFISPDYGSIIIDEVDIATNPTRVQSHIGYLAENNPLYKDMTVKDLLYVSAELKGLSGPLLSERIEYVVDAMNIPDVFFRPIAELSKGYKQRVGIAVTLLHQPKILILDEPTEGLDPVQRTDIRTLIKKLAKDHTILISTHVMQEVEAMCTRTIIINKGKLLVDATPDELAKGNKNLIKISIHIEGEDVVSQLKKIDNLQKLEINETKGKLVRAVLTSKSQNMLQPQLSKLIAKNKWIVWELQQEKQNLEDIFVELTQNK